MILKQLATCVRDLIITRPSMCAFYVLLFNSFSVLHIGYLTEINHTKFNFPWIWNPQN
jgi:hypothetical protein